MICKNRDCKFQTENERCSIVRKLELDRDGKCISFAPGFMHYVDLVYGALSRNNFIQNSQLTRDMKIGLYYVMTLFDLSLVEKDLGPYFGRIVQLVASKGGCGLKTEEITQRELNYEALEKLLAEFNGGKLPGQEQECKEMPKKVSQPFGWLSPTGEFTEGDWGEHEEIAYRIIEKKHFADEFRDRSSPYDSARDFLAGTKGYVLIHNPGGFGGYIVSHEKPLTKKQRDFLYSYFIDMGDSFSANRYINEEK